MERPFKILVVISAITVIFTVAIFVSPGFYSIGYQCEERVHDFSSLIRDRSVRRQDTDNLSPLVNWQIKKVTIDCGLWYFVACVNTKRGDGQEVSSKCHMTSYRNARMTSHRLPREMKGVDLESIYYNMQAASIYAMLEFQIETTVALVSMVIAVISIISYLRGDTTKRWIGLTSFLAHLTSGVLFAVISGKGWVFNAQSKIMLQGIFGYDMMHVKIRFPYCLFLCAVAALMCFGCAMKTLLTMTSLRDVKSEARVSTKFPGSIIGIHSDKLPYEGLIEFPTDSVLEIKGLEA